MLDRILVPLEGSTLSECVLPYTKAIAEAMGAQLFFVHVVEEDPTDCKPQVDPLNWYLRKVEAQSYMGQVSRDWEQTHLSITNVLLEGSAAERVVAYAHDNDVDLVVLSNHSHSGVAQKVIWQIRKSVLLVRAEWPTANPLTDLHHGRVIVPLDGSLRAESVLPIGMRLAQTQDAQLLLVHVVARPEITQPHTLTAEDHAISEQLTQHNLEAATSYLEQLQKRLPLDTQIRLQVSDSVIAALHDIVKQEQGDLLLLSAHGHSGSNARPYGNVTTNFITYGHIPLLIIQDLPSLKLRPLATNNMGVLSANAGIREQDFANSNYSH